MAFSSLSTKNYKKKYIANPQKASTPKKLIANPKKRGKYLSKERDIHFKFLKNEKRNFRYKKRLFFKKINFYGNKKKLLKLKNSFSRLLHIRVNPNNIFFNLKLIKPKRRTLAHASSGLFKVKLTKKRLSHNAVPLLDSFLSRIRSKIFRRNLIIVIIAPKNLKFKLIKSISKLLKKRKLIIYVKPLKCFNGCRPPKKRRRKQKGLRLLKK